MAAIKKPTRTGTNVMADDATSVTLGVVFHHRRFSRVAKMEDDITT